MDKLNRRSFLWRGSALAAASVFNIVPRHVLGTFTRRRMINSTLRVSVWAAWVPPTLGALQSENIVALCDVDTDYAANTFKQVSQRDCV